MRCLVTRKLGSPVQMWTSPLSIPSTRTLALTVKIPNQQTSQHHRRKNQRICLNLTLNRFIAERASWSYDQCVSAVAGGWVDRKSATRRIYKHTNGLGRLAVLVVTYVSEPSGYTKLCHFRLLSSYVRGITWQAVVRRSCE